MAAQNNDAPDTKTVLSKAVLKATLYLGIKQSELCHVIGKDRATIMRGIDPDSKPGELALMMMSSHWSKIVCCTISAIKPSMNESALYREVMMLIAGSSLFTVRAEGNELCE